MTLSELETLYSRLDSVRMSPAEHALARARLEQAEAFASALHAAARAVKRLAAGITARRARQTRQDVLGSEPL